MQTSEQIDLIATALAAFQGEMRDAPLDASNPHFKSKYATLTSVLETARPTLSKHGLALSHSVESDNDKYFVEAFLIHKSGQFFKSKVDLILDKNNMQSLGSAITYAKRYSAISLIGMADTDDDANYASGKIEAPKQKPVEAVREVSEIDRISDEPDLIEVKALVNFENRDLAKREGFIFNKPTNEWLKAMNGNQISSWNPDEKGFKIGKSAKSRQAEHASKIAAKPKQAFQEIEL